MGNMVKAVSYTQWGGSCHIYLGKTIWVLHPCTSADIWKKLKGEKSWCYQYSFIVLRCYIVMQAVDCSVFVKEITKKKNSLKLGSVLIFGSTSIFALFSSSLVSPVFHCLCVCLFVVSLSPSASWLYSPYTCHHQQQWAHLSAIKQSSLPTRSLDKLPVLTGSKFLLTVSLCSSLVWSQFTFALSKFAHLFVCLRRTPAFSVVRILPARPSATSHAWHSLCQASTWISSTSPYPATYLHSWQYT